MTKLSFFCSLLTTTLLSMPAIATKVDEDILSASREKSPSIKKAEIKASEDIGAFLGACVPQMRLLKEWIIPFSNSKDSSPLPVQSMINTSQEDHEATMTLFKKNAASTIKELVHDGLALMDDYPTELTAKKLDDFSAYEMLATLFARIYETELFLQELSPSYALHGQLKGYFILHKTRQKEKEGLQKLQQEQQTPSSPQEPKFSPKRDDLEQKFLTITEELEQKFRGVCQKVAQYRRLTVALPDGTPDFSDLTSEEPTSPLLSPRSSDSISPPKLSPSPLPSSSQYSIVQRGRAKTTSSPRVMTTSPKGPNSTEEFRTGSIPSLHSEKKRPLKEKRSESMSEKSPQGISATALQESSRFRALSTASSSDEKISVEKSPESPKSESPQKKRTLLGDLKRSLSGKKKNLNEVKSSSSSPSSRSSLGSSQEETR